MAISAQKECNALALLITELGEASDRIEESLRNNGASEEQLKGILEPIQIAILALCERLTTVGLQARQEAQNHDNA